MARGSSGACSWKKQREVRSVADVEERRLGLAGTGPARARTAARTCTRSWRGRAPAGSRGWCPAGRCPCAARAAGCSAAARPCTGAAGRRRPAAPGPSSTSSPAYSTPTRSHILAITARLWLMNSTDVSNSWRSAATRSSTSASTVASSAVVGSSRISSDGEAASAIAMTDPLRHPAGQLVRVAPHDPARVGDLHLAQHVLGGRHRRCLGFAGDLRTPPRSARPPAATGSAPGPAPGTPSRPCGPAGRAAPPGPSTAGPAR